MRHTNTLIIGQGLCGTWLSWWLTQQKHDFLLIDEGKTTSSSRIASGVINPVTGRILAKTWMIETLLPFALEAYTKLGNSLGIECIQSTRILHSFPSLQMKEAFDARLPEFGEYLQVPDDMDHWKTLMESPYGIGSIQPALLINLNLLLGRWKEELLHQNRLILERFEPTELIHSENSIQYRDIRADRIIYCDGIQGMQLPYFNRLPFAPNKGQALLLEIPGLPSGHIYKKGISIVPYPTINGEQNPAFFWAGSTYENDFITEEPTQEFRERTEQLVRNWIKLPFKTLHHWAGVRPANMERRPFAGMHPHYPSIGILNGTGTKGCSLAPYFGQQLAKSIVDGSPILPEAHINRFSRLLRP